MESVWGAVRECQVSYHNMETRKIVGFLGCGNFSEVPEQSFVNLETRAFHLPFSFSFDFRLLYLNVSSLAAAH